MQWGEVGRGGVGWRVLGGLRDASRCQESSRGSQLLACMAADACMHGGMPAHALLLFLGCPALLPAPQMEKTEKTIAEMEIDANLAHEFDRITEAGAKLQPLWGPG